MRNIFTKFFAATIICVTLAFGVMAGDISSGRTGDISSGTSDSVAGDISSGKAGDISSGKSMTKEDILADIFSSLTGILLGD